MTPSCKIPSYILRWFRCTLCYTCYWSSWTVKILVLCILHFSSCSWFERYYSIKFSIESWLYIICWIYRCWCSTLCRTCCTLTIMTPSCKAPSCSCCWYCSSLCYVCTSICIIILYLTICRSACIWCSWIEWYLPIKFSIEC